MASDKNTKELETFGQFFKTKRLKTGFSLRQFCLTHKLDAGNISKIERGLSTPPQSKEKLIEYAIFLNIEMDSDDWYTFCDYASASNSRIPKDVMSDEALVKRLPVVFRTSQGQKLTIEKLKSFAEVIRHS